MNQPVLSTTMIIIIAVVGGSVVLFVIGGLVFHFCRVRRLRIAAISRMNNAADSHVKVTDVSGLDDASVSNFQSNPAKSYD